MFLEQLKEHYPSLKLYTTQPQADATLFIHTFQDRWLSIKQAELNHNEKALLLLLLQSTENKLNFSKTGQLSTWKSWLFDQDERFELPSGEFRLIQFHASIPLTIETFNDFKQDLDSVFPRSQNIFLVEDSKVFVIEQTDTKSLHPAEFKKMLQLMEDDFSLSFNVFIGNSRSSSAHLRLLLLEEIALFAFSLEQNNLNRLQTVATALPFYALIHGTKQALITEIITACDKVDDWEALVSALWQNKGNISSTAKSLYLHRNTLDYKIRFFYKKTNLDLKEIDDLLLAYLLIFIKTAN